MSQPHIRATPSQNLGQGPDILIKSFRDFSRSLPTNVEMAP